jgi:hypothetical protein
LFFKVLEKKREEEEEEKERKTQHNNEEQQQALNTSYGNNGNISSLLSIRFSSCNGVGGSVVVKRV